MSAQTLAIVARQLNRASGARALRPLVFLTDTRRAPDPVAIVERWPRALARATMVILRHYDAADRAALAQALQRVCRARGVPLLIGADAVLALAVRADGVHWPDGLLKRTRRAGRRHPGWIVTAAAHDAAALRRAARAGLDAALLSPVFPTPSHGGQHSLGPLRFARLIPGVGLPVYALGGLDERTAPRLLGSGAAGLAAVGAFLR